MYVQHTRLRCSNKQQRDKQTKQLAARKTNRGTEGEIKGGTCIIMKRTTERRAERRCGSRPGVPTSISHWSPTFCCCTLINILRKPFFLLFSSLFACLFVSLEVSSRTSSASPIVFAPPKAPLLSPGSKPSCTKAVVVLVVALCFVYPLLLLFFLSLSLLLVDGFFFECFCLYFCC